MPMRRFQISLASTLASDLKNFILTQPCAFVGVKAKPECCSEQNRNNGDGPVKRASAGDSAFWPLITGR